MDHEIMVKLLEKKIDDKRFIKLISSLPKSRLPRRMEVPRNIQWYATRWNSLTHIVEHIPT